MTKIFTNISSFLLFGAMLAAPPAFACPNVLNILDTNCDGKIRMFVTGDSIVSGIGDQQSLGYPGRLERKVNDENFRVLNIGVPGTTPTRLQSAFRRNIDRGKKTTRNTTDVDYGLLQVGTNSYWDDEEPFQVVMKIFRLKKYLERALEERNGTRTVLFTATVPYTERDYQNPFIAELNKELKRKKGLNLLVRFDSIPVSQLAIEDTLHPSGKGYNKMMKRVRKALFTTSQRHARRLFSDGDQDGIWDETEVGRFLTSPLKADSDDDGLSDGEEVLTYNTNPNLADTDGDEVGDREEILNGTNPLVQDAE